MMIQENKNQLEQVSPMVLDTFRNRMPTTKQALDAYMRGFFGIFLASVPIEDGNSCPLDFAWDIYSTAMGLKPSTTLEDFNLLGVATRSGQKSLTCAAIELLMLIFDHDRDYFHMASIYDQSKVTYGYVQGVLQKPLMAPMVKSTTMKETIATHGRTLKIGTATMKSVNANHGSLIQDELDLTDHRVFVESKGILSPGANGKSPLDVKISSRKFAFGNIQTLMARKEREPKFPLKIHKWGVLEVMQNCPTERSGGETKSHVLYVDEENLHAIPVEQWSMIADLKKKSSYIPIAAYPGCFKCGIFSFCQGRIKKQVLDNPYLIKIDDVKLLYLTDDIEFFKSQRLNRQPSSLGLIYGVWDGTKHVLNFESMFAIFTGRPWGSGPGETEELTMVMLINIMIKAGCKLYLSADFGFNVAVAYLIMRDGADKIYVLDEVVVEGGSDADFGLACWERWKGLPITRGFGDVASPGAIREFSTYFPMLESILSGEKNSTYVEYAKLSKDYSYRFGLMRKLLSAPGTKESRLCVHPQCTELTSTISIYRNKILPNGDVLPDTPADGQRDHGPDGLGYGIVGIFVAGSAGATAAIATVVSTDDINTLPIGAPKPEELVAMTYGDGYGMEHKNVPPQSVPINPVTGLPLEPIKPVVQPIQPRGNKRVTVAFMD